MLYNDQFLNNFEIDRIQKITYLDPSFNFPWIFDYEGGIFYHCSFKDKEKKTRFSEEVINLLNKYREHTIASITGVVDSNTFLLIEKNRVLDFKDENQSMVYFANDSKSKLIILEDDFEKETISSVAGRAVIIPKNTNFKILSLDFAVITVIHFEGDDQKFKVSDRHTLPESSV